MNKYIDSDKFIKEFEKMIDNILASVDSGAGYVIDEVYKIIDSLQQEQPIQVNTLTWKDINDLERIINNVHYEFRNGIGEKSFGKEVLERFREERDEQEQPKVDLVAKLRHHLATTPREQLEKEWKELEHWNNVGPTVQEFLYGKQQEVELEKEIDSFWDSCIKHKNERGGNVIWSNKIEIEVLARRFYELGLNARKEE